MQKIDLNVQLRDNRGKGAARKLRREGSIPAVLYGNGKSTLLEVNVINIGKIIHSELAENTLIHLKIKNDKDKTVLLRDVQMDPINRSILHTDFLEISLDKPVRVNIPIEIRGDVPIGVKEQGILEHHLREIEIECLPLSIPDHIGVDASHLKIGESIHIRDIKLEDGINILKEDEELIVSISAPTAGKISEESLSPSQPS
ncbi:MAG: 50S ribosomal protein L25 [Nitrospirota bacterium]